MSSIFDDVVSLRPGKYSWRILVKVIALWHTQSYANARLPLSMEMVVMDAKGDKVHVHIKKTLIYKFDRLLSEGNVYSIAYFEVAENSGLFKTTRHGYKVNVQMNSEIRPVSGKSISADPYSFVPISAITTDTCDNGYLVDVIGILTGVGTEREIESHGKKTKMNVIEVEAEGSKIECALFGIYVDLLNTFLLPGDMINTVIILQFLKVKMWQGTVSLQNVHGATKMLFNPEHTLADNLRQRFTDNNDTPSQSLTQIPDSIKVGDEEDFLILTSTKTLAQVHDLKEDGFYIVFANISYIEDVHDWWYTACKCNKKVYADEKMYFCELCNRHVVTVIPRFRLQVMVSDETSTASLVLFDKEASALIGKSAAELIDSVDKKDSFNGLPDEIAGLVDKKFLFKLEVKNSANNRFGTNRFGASFKVKKICTDQSVIDQFICAGEQDSVGASSSLMLTTPTSSIKTAEVAKDLLQEFVVVDGEKSPETPDFVAIDLNGDTQEIINPKRTSSEDEDVVKDGVLSCNLKKKRVATKVKKEKM